VTQRRRLHAAVKGRAIIGWQAIVRAGRQELGTLAALLLCAGLILIFGIVASEMTEGETHAFDNAVILAMRAPGNHADPLGPTWFEQAVRDITSLGSNTVLTMVTLFAVGYLALSGARGSALLLFASVGGGAILIQVLKQAFGRTRPDLVPHSLYELTRSFPSGHATMSAVTYLTLGALLAKVQTRRVFKTYLLSVAVLLTLLVGVSRVYLGLHWPTDVLAGWCLGSAWAIGCWLLTARLSRARTTTKRA